MLSTRRRCRIKPAIARRGLRFELAPVERLAIGDRGRERVQRAASGLNVHLLRQPDERARHRHARRIGGRLAVRRRDLLITLLHLHSCLDDARAPPAAAGRAPTRTVRAPACRWLPPAATRPAPPADPRRRARPPAGYRFTRLTSSRTRLMSACRMYACSAPSWRCSNESMCLSVWASVSCTRSSVSRRSRVHRGNRPRAHRRKRPWFRLNNSLRAS